MATLGRPATAQCGTPAGARRHYRHHEQPCPPCLRANRERKSGANAGALSADPPRATRNGLPGFVPYVYQGRSPFMRRLAINAGLLPEPEEVPVAVRVEAEEPVPAVAPQPDDDGRCKGCRYLVARCNCADRALLRQVQREA